MTTHHGKGGKVKLGANTVAHVRNFSYTENVPTADSTGMGDSSQTHNVGIPGWNGKLDCWYDPTDTNGQVALSIGASVALELYTDGDASGKNYVTGTATIESIANNADMGSTVEVSFTFKGNGDLTHTAVA